MLVVIAFNLIQFKIIVGVVGALLAKHFLDVGTGK
jgi:hypothetical protein